MPLLDVTYPAGALSDDARATLVDELTTVMLRAERAPDTPFMRGVTWVYLHELPAGAVHAAGRPVAKPTFRVEATVPQGALSDRRKQEFVAEATRRVLDAAGVPAEEAMRVWVLVHEVPEGGWGAGGTVIGLETLRQAAAHERGQAAAGAPSGG
jgi:phenylpyruvate tautomerase PptA (4-oxalocrotonate tautomerase family)